ncbi:MAG: phosphatidate cytidylyltransferase [Ilumatobacteraceae bacterium]|jgi:phosphatidate cytidylyltransferase
MTDDARRHRRPDGRQEEEEAGDYGPPLFSDDSDDDDATDGLSFGASDTGPLPHWTEPPTGEVPRTLTTAAQSDPSDDLDVWSSFAGKAPVWRDDQPVDPHDETGEMERVIALEPAGDEIADITNRDDSVPLRREPGRITIGTDPTDDRSRPVPRKGRPGEPTRGGRPARSGSGARPSPKSTKSDSRDLPTAIGVGLLIGVVFVISVMVSPKLVLVVVIAVLGLGAIEYFDKVSEKGYRPATIVGILACVTMPIATYWAGEQALPLILALGFVAAAVTFIGAKSLEAAPMPNMAITTLGIIWIGFLGSFAALILRYSKGTGFPVASGIISTSIGTDTLCLMAIGVVANDIGALVLGSAAGKTPLRAWISPNKSVEGLFGGTVATILAMVIVGVTNRSTTWNSAGDLIILGIVISIMAPLGDLTESMFKRNLDVKDFGALIKGHGGVLDRFDGYLFCLPAVYYLLQILQPWVTK